MVELRFLYGGLRCELDIFLIQKLVKGIDKEESEKITKLRAKDQCSIR